MLCQYCKKNEATTHIKRVINGEATESHLCHRCAETAGVGDFFDDFSLNLPGFFSSFFGLIKAPPRCLQFLRLVLLSCLSLLLFLCILQSA